MKKLLLLTDFSEASNHALAFARSSFGDTVADFHLLCVYPAEPDGLYRPLHSAEATRTVYADRLNELVNALRREATTDWHTFRSSACQGELLAIVEKSLDREVYDFVIIGAKKDGTSELFGHSAIALTRQLKANILVIPLDAPSRPIRRVVVATNFANLKNAKLLGPIKELVALKGGELTLLSINTPDKNAVLIEQEIHLREFLKPIEPSIARLEAPDARQGIDLYLAGHMVDLLVMIPRYKAQANPMTGDGPVFPWAYTPAIPLITLYNDGSDDLPVLVDDVSTVAVAV